MLRFPFLKAELKFSILPPALLSWLAQTSLFFAFDCCATILETKFQVRPHMETYEEVSSRELRNLTFAMKDDKF